jgi:NTP pyrophosphatase (non-canonical NTP hydrolase)
MPSKAQTERLAVLIEEMGEASHVACKALRHGFRAYHPDLLMNNRRFLAEEIGDVLAAIAIMVNAGDLNLKDIEVARARKMERIQEFMHHQQARVFTLCSCSVRRQRWPKKGPVPIHESKCISKRTF